MFSCRSKAGDPKCSEHAWPIMPARLASQKTVFALYWLLAEPAIIKSHLLMPLYNFGVHSQDF